MTIRNIELLVGTGLICVLSSCAVTAPQDTPKTTQDEAGGSTGLSIATADSPPLGDSGMSAGAAFEGELAVSDSGCVGYAAGGSVITLLFPFGTTIRPNGDGVTLPSGNAIYVGDPLVGGGGALQQSGLDGVTIPEACAGDEIIGMELE